VNPLCPLCLCGEFEVVPGQRESAPHCRRFLLDPMTLERSALYFGRSLFAMGLAATIAAYAFWISVAAQPLFGVPLLDEE
jgi:hypothetical protein